MTSSDSRPITPDDDAPEVLEAQLITVDLTEEPAREVVRVRRNGLEVAKQAAAVVTTGFVAGALATAVVSRRVRRPKSRGLGGLGNLDVADGQRFLVEIHRLRSR